MIKRAVRAAVAVLGLAVAASASAQLPFAPSWIGGPSVAAGNFQVNYPYPGQCVTNPANQSWGTELVNGVRQPLPVCDLVNAPSFACPAGGGTNQTAAPWGTCDVTPPAFTLLNPLSPIGQPKFTWEVLNPPDYTKDTLTYPGADYYEIAVHEAWGFQKIASAVPGPVGTGLFPDPLKLATPGPAVPNGKQWTGIVDAAGAPLYTPIWGVGQKATANLPAGTIEGLLGLPAGTPTFWSANNFFATWPSISIRATKGRPVVVKWVNEFPNTHVFCPHPEAADWPCAIDRTFMGVKASIDPALQPSASVPYEGVNQWGSPQQPDNSWVTHLHGGEIPPSTDGFAEKWFGNTVTQPAYSPTPKLVSPPFENPSKIKLTRPAANFDTYTYPMVQEEALIWFHDHTLGKTHHNVIAGPAGFFPVKDPMKHGPVSGGALCTTPACCTAAGYPGGVCPTGIKADYTWLDPVTEPRNGLGQPKYDLFLAIQDRAFNSDGSINFSTGLGQPIVGLPLAPGNTPFTPGVNPQVHPTWVPEYFGDMALVNGVIWPKATVEPGWYRIRMVDGSDSRCWTIGFTRTAPISATKPKQDIPFWIIANDQGYMQQPVKAVGNNFTMCPGERYEILINFGALPGVRYPIAAPVAVYMTNTAAAPFPAGVAPFPATVMGLPNPYTEMNVVMRFDVQVATVAAPGVPTCTAAGLTWPTQPATIGCMPALSTATPVSGPIDPNYVDIRALAAAPGTVTRLVYLNERVDGITLAPLGMQLNGVPFEYKVTETPKKNTTEVWKFVNLTVDAHPMHPHLVKHQIISRQAFNVGQYKARLCGSTTCQPGPAPGNEMQVVPDVTPFLQTRITPVTPASPDGGWKDATRAMPGEVTTIIANWTAGWPSTTDPALVTAPGACTTGCAAPDAATGQYVYEDVTTGPYVWHCHINSHEDSEMMRTSLVVP